MNSWPEHKRFEILNRALDEILSLPSAARGEKLKAFYAAYPEDSIFLEQLLAASEASEVEKVLGSAVLHTINSSRQWLDQRLGDWHLTKQLGRGGMAEVWLAKGDGLHRDQRAAIKILSAEFFNEHALSRFKQERQILASLDNSRIARLLDGGISETGQPWLAMEYVAGLQIDQWCDQARLDLVARVRLLREVVIAVHGAHQLLIVHRDIKPANVMVTHEGQIKLLDFGIAKLLNQESTVDTKLPTLTHFRALTPQYASPEQLNGETVTTSLDIYQLGVLMVELLVGMRPFQALEGNMVELAHAIVNADPAAPSHMLKRTRIDGSQLEQIAAQRNCSAVRLQRQLRGDLDAIAQCALARNPSQRYQSALQFADDLDAWLTQQPVRARAPTRRYRLRRFVSRNWLASLFSVALFSLVLIYITTVLIQDARIRKEAELNRLVKDYLIGVLSSADPLRIREPQPSAELLLDQSLLQAREKFSGEPELLVELLKINANVKTRHGEYGKAAGLFFEALQLARLNHFDRYQISALQTRLGQSLHYDSNYDQAELSLREAHSLWSELGGGNNAWIALALADLLHSRGKYQDAEAILRQAFAQLDHHAPLEFAKAELQRDLGIVLRDSAQLEESHLQLETALKKMQQLHDRYHTSTAITQLALGRTKLALGQVEVARELMNTSMASQLKVYNSNHPVIGLIRHAMAATEEFEGHYDAAERELSAVLEVNYQNVSPKNILLAYARLDRAWARLGQQKTDLAEADLNIAQATFMAMREHGHPRWAEAQLARAVLLAQRGDLTASRGAIDAAIIQRSKLLGNDNALTVEARRWRKSFVESTEINVEVEPTNISANTPRVEMRRFLLLQQSLRK